MNAQHLYDSLKDALDYLGLRFSAMGLAEVELRGQTLIFSYNGRSATVRLT